MIGVCGNANSGPSAAGAAVGPATGSCIAYPGGPVIGATDAAGASGPGSEDDAALAAGPPPFNPRIAAETAAQISAARSMLLASMCNLPLLTIRYPTRAAAVVRGLCLGCQKSRRRWGDFASTRFADRDRVSALHHRVRARREPADLVPVDRPGR